MRPGGGRSDQDLILSTFVQFKQYVDSTVASTLDIMLGGGFPPSSSSLGDNGPSSRTDVSDLKSILLSNYSPQSLRNLPQPVPNDLPEHLDGSVFTFEDAFEDLLAISWGQPLPDIHKRYEQKQLLRQIFPSGEPTWSWYRRLAASGLLGSKPPENDLMDRPNWNELHRELERKASEVWGYPKKPSEDNLPAREAIEKMDELWKQAGQAFTGIEESLRQRGYDPWERPEPDHFEELFRPLRDMTDSGRRSWEAFMKSVSEREASFDKSRRPHSSSEIKVVESRDEHVDQHGYVHTKVTRRELDDEGNEVSKSTSYQMYPADPNSDERQGSEGSLDPGLLGQDRENKKKAGWFWK